MVDGIFERNVFDGAIPGQRVHLVLGDFERHLDVVPFDRDHSSVVVIRVMSAIGDLVQTASVRSSARACASVSRVHYHSLSLMCSSD